MQSPARGGKICCEQFRVGGSGPSIHPVLSYVPFQTLVRNHRVGKEQGQDSWCPASGSGWHPLLCHCVVLGFNFSCSFASGACFSAWTVSPVGKDSVTLPRHPGRVIYLPPISCDRGSAPKAQASAHVRRDGGQGRACSEHSRGSSWGGMGPRTYLRCWNISVISDECHSSD